jgi:hypothetical protein
VRQCRRKAAERYQQVAVRHYLRQEMTATDKIKTVKWGDLETAWRIESGAGGELASNRKGPEGEYACSKLLGHFLFGIQVQVRPPGKISLRAAQLALRAGRAERLAAIVSGNRLTKKQTDNENDMYNYRQHFNPRTCDLLNKL